MTGHTGHEWSVASVTSHLHRWPVARHAGWIRRWNQWSCPKISTKTIAWAHTQAERESSPIVPQPNVSPAENQALHKALLTGTRRYPYCSTPGPSLSSDNAGFTLFSESTRSFSLEFPRMAGLDFTNDNRTCCASQVGRSIQDRRYHRSHGGL